MLRCNFVKQEPNTIPLEDLHAGLLFKTQNGRVAYMVINFNGRVKLTKYHAGRIPAISFDSGDLHFFEKKHPVVELDGNLELKRIKIERGKRD